MKLQRFAAVFVALVVTLAIVSSLTQAQGLDLNRHCRDHGRSEAVLVGTTAYDLKCKDSSGALWDMSIQNACVEQYNETAVAKFRDFNDPYSWYCETSNSGSNSGGSNPPANNPAPAYNGSMDIGGWCRSVGHAGATAPGDAGSWICTNVDGSRARGVDFDPVCQFSSGGTHPYAGLTDMSNPYSWYCAQTPQGRPSSGNPNPAPVVPSNPQPQQPANSGNCSFQPLSVGGQGRMVGSSTKRIRQGAGTGYAQVGSLKDTIPFNVIGGPSCADGYTWYQIQRDAQVNGWVAAGTANDPWVEGVSGNNSVSVSPVTCYNSYDPYLVVTSDSYSGSNTYLVTYHVEYERVDLSDGRAAISNIRLLVNLASSAVNNIACDTVPIVVIYDHNGNKIGASVVQIFTTLWPPSGSFEVNIPAQFEVSPGAYLSAGVSSNCYGDGGYDSAEMKGYLGDEAPANPFANDGIWDYTDIPLF